MKGFIIICKNCGNRDQIKNGHTGSVMDETIDIDVSEVSDILGSAVESIDIICWKCESEVNI